MRTHILISVFATCCVGTSLEAQITLSPGDSSSRRKQPHAVDSVYVNLRDGDYAKVIVTHPTGFAVDIAKPDGSILKPYITESDSGADPVMFAAEAGAGKYAVVVSNSLDSALQYNIAFKERVSLDERMRPAPWRDELPSPTIERIRKQIEAGNTNTDEFWKTIETTGTPLIESADSKYDLVTFLWRGRNDTRNVYVNASFELPGSRNQPFHRVGATDIWYNTFKIPKGARFEYQLEPNRPSSPDADRVTRQVDPLNHGRKYDCPSEKNTYLCYSVGELPDAVAQLWLAKRPGVATGSIERKTIHSTIQNIDRSLTVYLPAGYSRSAKPYSLVVLFDGDEYLDKDSWNGQNVWDNLIAAGRTSPFVVVMVHNLPGRRLFDLIANKAFGDFMAKELAPWIRRNYNVTSDASRTVVGGASAGGFGATYMGLTHPDVYGNVLSMSGAFWWSPEHNGGICGGLCATPNGKVALANRDATTEPNWLASVALKTPSPRARFFLSVGTFEFDQNGGGGNILEATRQLRDILLAKNARVIYKQFVGGHDGLTWPGMLADGLQVLLGDSR